MSLVDETTRASSEETEPTPARVERHRGWTSLYAVAFALLLASAAAIAASSLGSLRSLGLLWLSIWLSGAAIVVAVVSVLLPRRG